jgi:hypothetical protein
MERSMELNDIQVNRFYRTRSGSICKVTQVAGEDEDKTVSFIRYTDSTPGPADEMPALFFRANVEEEVDAVDPQGRPMDTSADATPV